MFSLLKAAFKQKDWIILELPLPCSSHSRPHAIFSSADQFKVAGGGWATRWTVQTTPLTEANMT